MRTRAWLCAAIFAVGCMDQGGEKKADPQAKPSGTEGTGGASTMQKEEPVKPATPVKLTTADHVKKLQECDAAFLAKDDAKVAACYAADGKAMFADIPGMEFTGGKAIVDGLAKPWLAAMPDWAPKPQLVIASGNQVVTIIHATGTQSGPLMGMPASNKPVKGIGARYTVLTDDGKIKEDWHVFDLTSVLHQIGALPKGTKLPMPPRVDEKPLMETAEVVVATDSKTEADNVALVAKLDEAWLKGDVKALGDAMADDFTYVDNTFPGEIKGKDKNMKIVTEMNKAFSDKKFDVTARFGAGDYVVDVGTSSATNTGDMPSMKMKKSGKTITMKGISVFQIKDGKVARMWSFANGFAWLSQMGAVQMPAPAPGGAEGAPPAGEPPAEKPGKMGKKAPPTP